jgi:hypothetical protein
LDQKTGHVWDVVFRFGEMNKQKPGFIPHLFSEMVYSGAIPLMATCVPTCLASAMQYPFNRSVRNRRKKKRNS